MAFSLIHEFTVFSLFPIIIGDILQRTAAAAIDQQVTDGGKFFQRIVHGDKISQNPGYLLFTAPYKLCEGGCQGNDEKNFAMAFPIYIGKRGVEKYHELYARDRKFLHSEKPNAPFKKRPTKKLFTLCPSEVTKDQTMTTETETPTAETILTTEPPTSSGTLPNKESDTSNPATQTEKLIPTLDLSTNLETTTSKTHTSINTNIEKITESPLNTSTEIPSTTDSDALTTDITETEDITFEAYTDGFYTDTTFVTNANGVICPPNNCRKKKITATIVTLLVRNRPEAMKLDPRKADWNSDYSDLQDSFDLY